MQVFFDGHFITGAELKQRIVEKNSLAYGPSELSLSDPSSSLEFGDDYQIPKSSKVVVKRVAAQVSRALTGATRASAAPLTSAPPVLAPASTASPATLIDDFGADPFAAAASGLQQEQARAQQTAMEASTSAPSSVAAGGGWGAAVRGGRAGGGRAGMAAGRGAGRGGPVPRDHECKRCGEVGKHFFWLCPTKDDPAYDQAKPLQRVTGVPVTSLRRNADGSMLLPDGQVGELAPNQEAFAQHLARMAGTTKSAVEAAAAAQPGTALLSLPGTGVKEEVFVKSEDVKQENGVVKREEGDIALESLTAGGLFDEDEETPNPALTLKNDEPVVAVANKGADGGMINGTGPTRSRPPPPLPLADMFNVLHAVLSEVLPSKMTMKQCDEAFGAGGPLTRAEFERFKASLRASLQPMQRTDSGGGMKGASGRQGLNGNVRRDGGSTVSGGERRREGRSRSRSRSRGKKERSRSRSRSRGASKRISRTDGADTKKKRSSRRSRSRSASPAARKAKSPVESERRPRHEHKSSPRPQVG